MNAIDKILALIGELPETEKVDGLAKIAKETGMRVSVRKPKDPELLKLESRKTELEQSDDVAEYAEILVKMKGFRKYTRSENLPQSVGHDETFSNIQFSDGTVIPTNGKEWLARMESESYSIGQIQAVRKSRGQAQNHGMTFKNTIVNQ